MSNAQWHDLRMPVSGSIRVLLELGRVSNLPTVWSNCLAGWLLAGGTSWNRFTVLCAASTFLYLGGMFLNDAFDVEFDRKYRPERPIASGRIRSRAVWVLGGVWLGLGWFMAGWLGASAWAVGTALLLTIVVYDVCHKRFAFAPWLMASCRFLVYVLAGTAAQASFSPSVTLPGLALAVYVLGLSYIARAESAPGLPGKWPTGLLLAPAVLSLLTHGRSGVRVWVPVAMQTGWLVWCLCSRIAAGRCLIRTSVEGLLAGIALVDLIAAIPFAPGAAPVFAGLFLLAIVLQRTVPAT